MPDSTVSGSAVVALGQGASFVPNRARALSGQKRNLQRLALPERFVQELVVVIRKRRSIPPHLRQLIENVRF